MPSGAWLCQTRNHSHLIMVNYDAHCARASDIVRKVNDLGIRAQAVGM